MDACVCVYTDKCMIVLCVCVCVFCSVQSVAPSPDQAYLGPAKYSGTCKSLLIKGVPRALS